VRVPVRPVPGHEVGAELDRQANQEDEEEEGHESPLEMSHRKISATRNVRRNGRKSADLQEKDAVT
jgi:hypothetical protein